MVKRLSIPETKIYRRAGLPGRLKVKTGALTAGRPIV